jgi:arabinofuranosyltransferase
MEKTIQARDTLSKFRWGAWALCALLATANLTLIEDAFIPLRSATQWLAGNGLVWNAGERVQVSTSLPWQVLMIAPAAWDPIKGLALLTWTCALGAMAITFARCKNPWALALLTLGWAGSHMVRDYMACGMESALYAVAIAWALCTTTPGTRTWALAIGSLPAIRHDLILTAAPLAATHLEKWAKKPRLLAWGALPLLIISAGALFYYGSALPNTAYTKLATNLPPDEVASAGWEYIKRSLSMDPLLLLLPLTVAWLAWPAQKRNAAALMASLVATAAYTWLMAADYMLGRFLVPPAMLALAILATLKPTKWEAITTGALLAIGVLLGHNEPKPQGNLVKEPTQGAFITLKDIISHNPLDKMGWAQMGGRLVEEGRSYQGSVGMMGLTADKNHHICDFLALTDPLLARLPAPYNPKWKPGHYTRHPPQGYGTWIETGDWSHFENPEVRHLARLIQKATKDPLLSPKRWEAISELQFWSFSEHTRLDMTYPDIRPLKTKSSLQGNGSIITQNGILEATGWLRSTEIKKGKPGKQKILAPGNNPGPWNLIAITPEKNKILLEPMEGLPNQILNFHPTNGKPIIMAIAGDHEARKQQDWTPITKTTTILEPITLWAPKPLKGTFTVRLWPQPPPGSLWIKTQGVTQPLNDGGEIQLNSQRLEIGATSPQRLNWVALIPKTTP